MTMQIEETLIFRLEQLAKLELDAEERAGLMSDLNHILTLVDQMNQLDTSQVEPLAYVNAGNNRLRADAISNQTTHEDALRGAPDTDGKFFKVPKVIDL